MRTYRYVVLALVILTALVVIAPHAQAKWTWQEYPTIAVNYDRPVSALESDVGINQVIGTPPRLDESGWAAGRPMLLRVTTSCQKGDVRREMEANGCRPANPRELLVFCARFPDVFDGWAIFTVDTYDASSRCIPSAYAIRCPSGARIDYGSSEFCGGGAGYSSGQFLAIKK